MVQISRYPTLGRTKVVMQTDVNGQNQIDRYVLLLMYIAHRLKNLPDVNFFTWLKFPITTSLNAHWLKTINKKSANLIFPFTFKGVLNLF